MANTMEDQKTTDPEMAEKARKQAFTARVTGIVTGAVGGGIVGYRWLRRSLFKSMRDAMYRPDWEIFHDNKIIENGVVKNEAGRKKYHNEIDEPFDRSEQAKWLEKTGNNAGFLAERYATIAPDNAIKAAFQDICKTDAAKKNFINPVAIAAQKAFEEKRQAKLNTYNDLIAQTCEQYGKSPEKLKSEIIKQNERLRKFLYTDYKKYFEEPIFNELWKRGKKDGHLGFGLRQADNKEEIMIFGAIAGVTIGFIATKAARWFLHRNDGSKEQTHAQQLAARREAGSAETLGAVNS